MGAPARAHVLPGAGRGSPARAFWANAAAPPEPGRGIGLPPLRGKGARAGLLPTSPFSVLVSFCQSPGSAWHPAGLPKESLPGVSRFAEGGKGLGSWGQTRPIPRARTPDSSGLRWGGAVARPGRVCEGFVVSPRGLVSAPGLGPFLSSGSERPSCRPPGKCGESVLRPAAATSESARPKRDPRLSLPRRCRRPP